MAGWRWRAIDDRVVRLGAASLVFALLTLPTGLGATPASPAGLRPAFESPSPAEATPYNLSLSPVNSWVTAGNTTTLRAAWTATGSNCTIEPSWFRWFELPRSVGGIGADPNGSYLNVTANSTATGFVGIGVRSAASLTCGSALVGVFATATASVTEVARLLIRDPLVSGEPLSPGGRANLTADIEGGVPPYRIVVDWGDGNESTTNVSQPGPFTLSHAYSPGEFGASVDAVDSYGQTTTGTLAEAVQVSGGPALAVTSSVATAEVGIPVSFSSRVLHPPTVGLTQLTACGRSVWTAPPAPSALTCIPTRAGVLPASLWQYDGGSGQARSQTLDEPVAAALTVTSTAPPTPSEWGQPVIILTHLTAGVPPFDVMWSASNGAISGQQEVPSDGTFLVELSPLSTGVTSLSIRVSDADGALAETPPIGITIAPALEATAHATSSVQPPTAEIRLDTAFVGGVGPLAWVVAATPAPLPGMAASGWTPASSTVTWSGRFEAEGDGTVALVAVDADGALVQSTVNVTLVPPPVGTWSADAVVAGGEPVLNVTFRVDQGVPPFALWINATGSGSWKATDSSDGTFAAQVALASGGPVSVTLVAVDGLGGKLIEQTDVVASPYSAPLAGNPAVPDPTPWVMGGVGLAAALVAVFVYVRRRRSPAPTAVPPNPERVLEQILAPADGAERVTVELLAEEGGIPLEQARSTLDRLIREGRVRSEVAPDGEEVLAWVVPDSA